MADSIVRSYPSRQSWSIGSRASERQLDCNQEAATPVMLATISTYQVYLSIHILAAVVWVGGAVTLQVFAARAIAANSGERMAVFSGDAEWIGTRIFMPTSLVLIVFGFLLIHEGSLGYPFWIVFPIVVWLGSFLVGVSFLGPQSGKLKEVVAAEGLASPAAGAIQRRLMLTSRIEALFLVLVVLDMALKPGA
jgi:hypothetical protein